MAGVTLQGLMDEIGQRYRFTNEFYPGADLSTPGAKLKFATGHSLKHMSKLVGRIAEQTESADHGGSMDLSTLKVTTAKMLVNVCKLAEELGMSGGELAGLALDSMKSR